MYLNKMLICLAFLFVFLGSYVCAETIKQPDLKPFVPRIMAKGNGNVVRSQGLPSAWSNPAGIANFDYKQYETSDTEITLISISIKTQPLLDDLLIVYENAGGILESNYSSAQAGTDIIAASGLRVGSFAYGGIVSKLNTTFRTRKNLGSILIGSSLSNELSVKGYGSALSSSGILITQSEIYLGYAYRFQFDRIKIGAGVVVRPLARSYTGTISGVLLSNILDGNIIGDAVTEIKGLHGFGVGLDAGIDFEYSGVMLGAAIRDIYTKLYYRQASTIKFFSGKDFGTETSDEYIIPYSFDAGIGYEIKYDGYWWTDVFNAFVYVQMTDILSNTNIYENRTEDVATHIHMGIDMNILPPLFNLQLGLNQGYPTFGMGTKVGHYAVNIVYYHTEEGKKIGEIPSPGVGLEFAVKW